MCPHDYFCHRWTVCMDLHVHPSFLSVWKAVWFAFLTGTQILTYFPCFILTTDSLTSPPLSNQVELKKNSWQTRRSYTDTCVMHNGRIWFGVEALGLHTAVALAACSSRVAFASVCWQRLWVWDGMSSCLRWPHAVCLGCSLWGFTVAPSGQEQQTHRSSSGLSTVQLSCLTIWYINEAVRGPVWRELKTFHVLGAGSGQGALSAR